MHDSTADRAIANMERERRNRERGYVSRRDRTRLQNVATVRFYHHEAEVKSALERRFHAAPGETDGEE